MDFSNQACGNELMMEQRGLGWRGCCGVDDLTLACGWITGGRKATEECASFSLSFLSLILSFRSLALPSITSAHHKWTITCKDGSMQMNPHNIRLNLRKNYFKSNQQLNPNPSVMSIQKECAVSFLHLSYNTDIRGLTDGRFWHWSFNGILAVETQQVELCETFPSERFNLSAQELSCQQTS